MKGKGEHTMQAPTLEVGRRTHRLKPRFLIRLNLPETDWDDAWELCRGIERCGGHRTDEGFAFCGEIERTLALEILQERFGRDYLEAYDATAED
jgi:hypothetical protein